VLDVLQRVQLSNAELSLAKKYLAQRRTDVEQQGAQMRNALKLQHDQLKKRISNLTDLLLDGTIQKPLFESKQMACSWNKPQFEEKRREMENGGGAATKQLEKTVELAQSASLLYRTASTANNETPEDSAVERLCNRKKGRDYVICSVPPYRGTGKR